jgi:hypothetical protein
MKLQAKGVAQAAEREPIAAIVRGGAMTWKHSPRQLAQRREIAASFGSTPVMQRISKRWKNVLSLGIRKAYVEIKRAARANAAQGGGQAQQPAPQQDQQPSDLDRFVTAYGKSRHYHSTMNSDNLPKIEEHGLLNYQDRVAKLGGDVTGYSNRFRDSEFKGDEKKGVFLAERGLVEENRDMLSQNAVRAFLPRHRTEKASESEAESEQMFKDRKFPGPAYITRDSIGPELVSTKAMLELLDADDAKLPSILKAVASQYELDPAELPDLDEMKALLREAIRTRRLSNAALDNL